MYGLIVVEPEEGLPKVDREYYVVQGDFYTRGGYKEPGLQPFDMDKAIARAADLRALQRARRRARRRPRAHGEGRRDRAPVRRQRRAEPGELVPRDRRDLRPRAHARARARSTHDVQTTLIPAGGAAVVDFALEVPGTFILVDHSLIRAFNKGALGMLKVEGAEDKLVYSGKEVDEVYLAEYSEKAIEAKRAAAEAAEEGDIARGAPRARQGRLPGHLLHLPPGGGAGPRERLPAAREVRLPDGRQAALDPRRARRPLGPDHGERAAVRQRDAVAGRTSPTTRSPTCSPTCANSFGNQGEPVTDDEVAKVRAALPKPAEGGHP